MPHTLCDFIRDCLQYKIDDRPTAQDLLEYPVIRPEQAISLGEINIPRDKSRLGEKKVENLTRLDRVVGSLRGCEKRNLYKILHRSSDPKNFLNFFFSSTKNNFENEKIFFWKFSKKNS